MFTTREMPVAKRKKPTGKSSSHDDRKDVYAPVQVFRDLAKWLADISTYETRRLRESGRLEGQEFASVAKIVDPLLREWAWQRYKRIKNVEAGLPPGHPVGPPPDPPKEAVELE